MPKPVIFDDAGRARVTKTVGKKLAKAGVIVIEDDEEPKAPAIAPSPRVTTKNLEVQDNGS